MPLGRPKQRTMCTARQDRLAHQGFAGFVGMSILLLYSGCAQLDQMLGRETAAVESAQPAQAAAPVPVAAENRPAQAAEPISKSAVKKKTDESRPSSVATEPRQQAPVHVPAHPTAPAAGVAKQPEPAAKQSEQNTAITEKEQPSKEKKSRVASDKKSKKSPKSQAESQPPTEDVFLPPVPLPSKPAAIGGSGG